MKPGNRYRSVVCLTEVVVVRPAEGVVLECGGVPMVDIAEPSPDGAQPHSGWDAGTLLGKRYEDPVSGLELLCVRPGAGSLGVGGRPMSVKASKNLPASD